MANLVQNVAIEVRAHVISDEDARILEYLRQDEAVPALMRAIILSLEEESLSLEQVDTHIESKVIVGENFKAYLQPITGTMDVRFRGSVADGARTW